MQYFLYSQITTDRHQIFIARRPLMEKSLRSIGVRKRLLLWDGHHPKNHTFSAP